jgi:hypothetical protein
MNTVKPKLLLAMVLAGALAAGCGGSSSGVAVGGSGGGGGSPGTAAPEDIGSSVSALLAYMTQLLAADESSEPVDINAVTLALDDGADPLAVSF